MSTNAQAICHHYGHDWMPWGLFSMVQKPFEITSIPVEPVHQKEDCEAYRYRQCERCGTKQRQSWAAHTIEDIEQ